MKNKTAYKITSILFILLSFASVQTLAEESNKAKSNSAINVCVDPRVELISIIFKLAGNPEYNRSQYFSYVGDIESHFGKFKEHDVVKLAKKLRSTRGVSYDAPMSLAIYIKDINDFDLLLPLDPWPKTLDSRWNKDSVLEFLRKAKQFAQETEFDKFFKSHKSMYDKAAENFRSMMENESHLEWFDEFFGAKPGAEFKICLGITNGPSNYGSRIKLNGKETYYCIQGIWKFALLGFGEPRFDKSMLPIVIHEFCHSYANPIVDAHKSEIEKSGKRIYALVQEKMKRNAYGNWLTVMRESLVRASVVRYLAKNEDNKMTNQQIQSDINKGFLWMRELSDLLIEYEQNRDKYPDLDAFFPKVIEFFDNYQKG
ncbi:MAG: DUF4932 domain-containing protein [Sedimentisphaerales bacterium]|nr:DUF4932 domain-containing protein [Sedimentisphaerales bacterium]